jgi:hypothetical protein
MSKIKSNLFFVLLTIIFLSFFTEVLMLIMYYPSPIEPFNIPKVFYTVLYYISMFVFGILLASLARYGKNFVWIFLIFVSASLIFAYIFSNISYFFMGNNLGAQLGEFKSLMPKIISLTIFVSPSILIFGYSISFIIHSIYGRYSINDSKTIGNKKIFAISFAILLFAHILFIPTIYNINDIGSYWNRVDYNLTLTRLNKGYQLEINIDNNLNAEIELVNIYIPIYSDNQEFESIGTNYFKGLKPINSRGRLDYTINLKGNNLRLGHSYIKFLYKGKILRKDFAPKQ